MLGSGSSRPAASSLSCPIARYCLVSLLSLPPASFLGLAASPFIWHLCLLSPPPPPGCSCPSLCFPHPHHLRLSPCFPPSDQGPRPPPHLSQALCWPPLCSLGSLLPPLCGRLAVLGRPRCWFSLGSAVQLLPGKGQLAGWGRREVSSWGVPGVLSGPSRLGEYRGVRLWSEPSVQALRSGSGAREGEEVGNGWPLSPEATCPLVSSA